MGESAGSRRRPAQGAFPNRYTFTLVYAVIKTGGKQERVEEGQRLSIELLGAAEGEEVSFQPILLVDGGSVVAGSGQLAGASVTARVLGEGKGPKIRGFTYKPKTRSRRAWGHRQRYSNIEITGITAPGASRTEG